MDSDLIVYCAGPQHSPEESMGMQSIASLLETRGWPTYLSARDGLDFALATLKDYLEGDASRRVHLIKMMAQMIFALEIFQVVRRCSSLCLNMNGRVPDEDSVFKASLAFSVGKPVTLYKNDNRSIFNGYDNPMILGLSGGLPVVRKRHRIPGGIIKAVERCKTYPTRYGHGGSYSLRVTKVVDLGGEVWRHVKGWDRSNNDTKDFCSQLLRLIKHFEQQEGIKYIQR